MTAPARTRRLVVVGASLAGLRVVEGARDAGFDGELTLIGDEPVAPYDRTVLSTRFLEDREEPQTPVYRPADDLRRDLDVDLRLGVPPTRSTPGPGPSTREATPSPTTRSSSPPGCGPAPRLGRQPRRSAPAAHGR